MYHFLRKGVRIRGQRADIRTVVTERWRKKRCHPTYIRADVYHFLRICVRMAGKQLGFRAEEIVRTYVRWCTTFYAYPKHTYVCP